MSLIFYMKYLALKQTDTGIETGWNTKERNSTELSDNENIRHKLMKKMMCHNFQGKER